jgi:hypothetical protein
MAVRAVDISTVNRYLKFLNLCKSSSRLTKRAAREIAFNERTSVTVFYKAIELGYFEQRTKEYRAEYRCTIKVFKASHVEKIIEAWYKKKCIIQTTKLPSLRPKPVTLNIRLTADKPLPKEVMDAMMKLIQYANTQKNKFWNHF